MAGCALSPRIAAGVERQRSDIYFVAIGNEHYVGGGAAGLRWPSVPAPVNSATRVAGLLQSSGARFGILVTSDRRHAVTRADMRRAIVDLKKRIRADRPARPLVFFYYMGHGLGDTFNQTLYLVPGDMALGYLPSQTASAILGTETVSNLDVVSSLANFRMPPALSYFDEFFPGDLLFNPFVPGDQARARARAQKLQDDSDRADRSGQVPKGDVPPVPYVALFDNCYDLVVQDLIDLRKPVPEGNGGIAARLLGRGSRMIETAVQRKILKDLGEIESEGVVLYAAKPGTHSDHYANPSDPSDGDPVGPLARRLMIAALNRKSPPVTLRDLERAISFEGPDTYGADKPSPYSVGSPIPYALRTTNAAVLDTTVVQIGTPGTGAGTVDRRGGSATLPPRAPG